MKTCEYPTTSGLCGSPAVAVVKLEGGKRFYDAVIQQDMAVGTGSTWRPLCELHRNSYPDHEGFELSTDKQFLVWDDKLNQWYLP